MFNLDTPTTASTNDNCVEELMRLPLCHHLARRRPLASQISSGSISSAIRILPRALTTLAIETSCDDTAVAILSKDDDATSTNRFSLRFNERISSDHRQFRGIEPLVAVQGHTSAIAPLLRKALAYLPAAAPDDAAHRVCWAPDGSPRRIPDFVSVTRGPGITPNLSVGISTAKGLAVAWGVPLVGVHHMQAHALTPRLVRALGMPMPVDDGFAATAEGQVPVTSGPEFPFLSLLVSGGHTQLVHSRSLADHRIVVTTADVAIGNLLDHASRDILPPDVLEAAEDVMYGRTLEAFAFPDGGTPEEYAASFEPSATRAHELTDPPTGYDWVLPLPLRQTRRLAYSFSSIGTVVQRIAQARRAQGGGMDVAERRALARHTMATAFRHLAGRICLALDDVPALREASTLVVAGGVACNRFLMHALRSTLEARGHGHLRLVVPPPALCTDNAAMIAWAGMEMYEAGFHTDLSVLAINKWPMDPEEGPGILGAPGWLRRPGYE